jgi:hypothetical protein
MRAVKLESVVTRDRKLTLTVPPEIPSGQVEVLILAKDSAEVNQDSLETFLKELSALPVSTRTPAEFEVAITAERNAWDE